MRFLHSDTASFLSGFTVEFFPRIAAILENVNRSAAELNSRYEPQAEINCLTLHRSSFTIGR